MPKTGSTSPFQDEDLGTSVVVLYSLESTQWTTDTSTTEPPPSGPLQLADAVVARGAPQHPPAGPRSAMDPRGRTALDGRRLGGKAVASALPEQSLNCGSARGER